MKHKRLKLCALLLFGLGLTGLQAQESVNAAGGNASGSGGTVSYTVGQVVYTTKTGTNGSVAEGVQQAYEISDPTGEVSNFLYADFDGILNFIENEKQKRNLRI